MTRQQYKAFISRYSKWFQFLERYLGPVSSIDLVTGILGLAIKSNVLLAITGLIAGTYVFLYITTFLIETIYYAIRNHKSA